MYAEIKSAICKHTLIQKGDRVGVAVSGGMDSMGLITVMQQLSDEIGFSLCCLHFEHGMRAQTSKEDARFVQRQMAARKINCIVEAGDVPAYARQHGMNEELAARNQRYAFFARAMQKHALTSVAVAHHMEDQAETVLLHLTRGSGRDGLMGMPVYREPGIIRPMLGVTKEQIVQYVRENQIAYREDETNKDSTRMRNYMRMEILPALKRINPSVSAAIARTADILREEKQVMDICVQEAYAKMVSEESGKVIIQTELLLREKLALQRLIVRQAICAQFPIVDIEKKHIDAILKLLQKGTGKAAVLKNELFVSNTYGRLIISKKACRIDKYTYKEEALLIPGITPGFGKGTILCEYIEMPDAFTYRQALVQYANAQMLSGAVVRTRRDGDWIMPFGMTGKKKIKDVFIDEKIPKESRREIPLLAVGNEILWIVGYMLSEKLRVVAGETILKLSYAQEREKASNDICR